AGKDELVHGILVFSDLENNSSRAAVKEKGPAILLKKRYFSTMADSGGRFTVSVHISGSSSLFSSPRISGLLTSPVPPYSRRSLLNTSSVYSLPEVSIFQSHRGTGVRFRITSSASSGFLPLRLYTSKLSCR